MTYVYLLMVLIPLCILSLMLHRIKYHSRILNYLAKHIFLLFFLLSISGICLVSISLLGINNQTIQIMFAIVVPGVFLHWQEERNRKNKTTILAFLS